MNTLIRYSQQRIMPTLARLLSSSILFCHVASGAAEPGMSIPVASTPHKTPSPVQTLATPIASLQIVQQLPLMFTSYPNIPITAIPTSKQHIDTLHFGNAPAAILKLSENLKLTPLVSGGTLSWRVTPAGTQVYNPQTMRWSYTTTLTSNNIRPKQVLVSEALGDIWFHGEDLYRYRTATNEIHRFSPSTGGFGIIYKILVSPAGLWLVTEQGIFLFDVKKEALQKINIPAAITRKRFINAVVVNNGAWLVSEGLRLIKIVMHSASYADIAVSTPFPLGAPAEMVFINQELWMLTNKNHGDAYNLVFSNAAVDKLFVTSGKYFSLREVSNQLLASTHDTIYSIDPTAKTVAHFKIDAQSLAKAGLGKKILFVGSSYGEKDPSEIVEYRPPDISRGWVEPSVVVPVLGAAH